MLKELDTIVLSRDIPEHSLSRGDIGAVVHSYKGGESYEVEFVNGQGNSTETSYYTYSDRKVEVGKYHYRLKQLDYDGTFSYSSTIEVDVTAPKDFALYQNYPNPFNPSTVISFSVPAAALITLTVYDVLGNEITTLINEEKSAGTYEVSLDAGNLSTGMYFYTLQSGSFSETKKMVLLK